MRTKDRQAVVSRLHKPDFDSVYRNSYLKPHPSKRGSAKRNSIKKGWAFSFIVSRDGYDAPASSVDVYPNINDARYARTSFLKQQNGMLI